MNNPILVPGMGSNADVKPLQKNRTATNGSATLNGVQSWMAELSSALNKSTNSSHGASHAAFDTPDSLLHEEKQRETAKHSLTDAASATHDVSQPLQAGHLTYSNAPQHTDAAGHVSGSHGHDAHSNVAHHSALGTPSQAGIHTLADTGRHGITTTAGTLSAVAAETHHALTHAQAHGAVQTEAQAAGLTPSLSAAQNPLAGAASAQMVGTAVDANGNALPASPAEALAALLRSAQASGDIRDASLRIIKVTDTSVQDALAASGATRRKLMDALQDIGTTGSVAELATTGFMSSIDSLQPGGLSFLPADVASPTFSADALTERAVGAISDLTGFLSLTERAPGAMEGLQGADAMAAVNADLDWMAVLEQQAGLSRLRETDSLRLDLQLQDSQRVALEASLQDGVLTVKLGARADGSFWVPPEQLEALKASLRMSTPEVQEVVFEQSADLGSSLSDKGSDTASDAGKSRNEGQQDGGSGRRMRDSADEGRLGMSRGASDAIDRGEPGSVVTDRQSGPGAGGVSLRA